MNTDPLQDNYHDILEFAENYFNAHERSPEGMLRFETITNTIMLEIKLYQKKKKIITLLIIITQVQ
jgi:hypothetical protein